MRPSSPVSATLHAKRTLLHLALATLALGLGACGPAEEAETVSETSASLVDDEVGPLPAQPETEDDPSDLDGTEPAAASASALAASGACTFPKGLEPGRNVNTDGEMYSLARIQKNWPITGDAEACPPVAAWPVRGGFDPPPTYVDGKTNPAFSAYMKPFVDFVNQVQTQSDRFLRNTDRASANASGQCAMKWLGTWAADFVNDGEERLTEAHFCKGSGCGNASYSNDNWNAQYQRLFLSTAMNLAFAKLESLPDASDGQRLRRANVRRWLDTMVPRIQSFIAVREAASESNKNNMSYWAGLGVMANGYVVGDASRVAWGVKRFDMGIDDIRADGTLPAEVARGDLAYVYHLFSAKALVLMAELATANGRNLYAGTTAGGRSRTRLFRLTRLVHELSYRNGKPRASLVWNGLRQQQGPGDVLLTGTEKNSITWIEPFYSRFGNKTVGLQWRDAITRTRRFGGLGDWRSGGNWTAQWGVRCPSLGP
ncbi:MAG: alginate lyase family protein [Deltaproteobacteria bacterium]|nr:alginate lyase family protein [Deltaproteobacteria bacterium]